MAGHGPERDAEAPPDRLRLDKWLWQARFVRHRALAVRLIQAGHARIGGRRVATPAHPVRAGDVLTLALPGRTLVVRVKALGERRGPASEAAHLFEVMEPGGNPRDEGTPGQGLATRGETG